MFKKIKPGQAGFLPATSRCNDEGELFAKVASAREAAVRCMFQKITVGIVFGIFLISVSDADEWGEAEKQIVRLDPTGFSELPGNIINELKMRGCRIPQAYGFDKPHNVIRGEFAAKHQQDWAVLCSKGGSSEILIFWGGPVRCSSGLRKSQDRHWLQVVTKGKISYSRAIDSVGGDQILSYYEAFGSPTPPPIKHEGIDDAFVGKASVIHYCNQGKWIELTGMD